MFKYIKWELKSLLKNYAKVLIVIGVILGLTLVLPLQSDSLITELVLFAFSITIMILGFSTFVFGTKKVIDTFKKPTFMLESMIAFPPYKILLAKYLLAIILNAVCSLLFVISVGIIIYKASSFPEMLEMIKVTFEIANLPDLINMLITMMVCSTSFTSLVTLSYVLSKSLFPKSKGAFLFGIMVWYVLTVIMNSIMAALLEGATENIILILFNLVHLSFTAVFYFFTVKLIENKLEIYN